MTIQNGELGTEVIGTARFEELLDAFQDAFSDYLIDVTMDGRKLSKMLLRRSVDLGHSIALVEGRRILGFVLNGLRHLGGAKTGYDAGTGVRPDHRGNGLGRRLLEDTLEHLRNIGANRYLLEVLTENRTAIALYESAGFSVDRRLRCFKTTSVKIREDDAPAITPRRLSLDKLPWNSLRSLRLFEPSWQNNMEFLASAGATERAAVLGTEETAKGQNPIAVVAEGGEQVLGFIICDSDGGEILDLGLPGRVAGREDRGSGHSPGTEDQIFSHLLREANRVWTESNTVSGNRGPKTDAPVGTDNRGTEVLRKENPGDAPWEVQFLNVDTASTRALSLLDRFGFEPFIDQYEMSRSL